ncbi:MAG TPA: glycerophosphodiester phosphodiesterase [Deinococcales bacterium]|nr:glycerophosphodiester phosphodiesterase [Deinococcales bacterium]
MTAAGTIPPAARAHPWSDRAPVLLGNGGAPDRSPINSLPAFNHALQHGLDGVSADVQFTRDRILVLRRSPYFEDDEAASHTFISRNTFAELRRREPHVLPFSVLRGILEANPDALASLDLKTPAPWRDGRAWVLAEELAAWPFELTSRLWISSFDPIQLFDLHMAGTLIPLAFVAYQESELELLKDLPVSAVHAHHSLLTEERLHEWRRQGLAVFTWNVNDTELARGQLQHGVDGLIGNDTAALLNARGTGG